MHVHHAILYISLPSLHHHDMKLPNFTSPLYGVAEHNSQHKNCPFHFLNLDNVTYGPKENFAKIYQIKWNWIRSVKFEILRIDFEVTFSVCCHPEILLPWKRDVTTSPLYRSFCALIRRRTIQMGGLAGNTSLGPRDPKASANMGRHQSIRDVSSGITKSSFLSYPSQKLHEHYEKQVQCIPDQKGE